MAGKRKLTQSDELAAAVAAAASAAAAAATTTMVTRSSTRRATRSSAKTTPKKSIAAPEPSKKKSKKAKTTAKKEEKSPIAAEAEKPLPEGSKTIIIEHCKQCNSFKTRAVQVKIGLENGVAGVKVVVNPEKPRKGCFEIREDGGEVFVSLLDMKRPFSPMKALNMDKVISDIIDKIK